MNELTHKWIKTSVVEICNKYPELEKVINKCISLDISWKHTKFHCSSFFIHYSVTQKKIAGAQIVGTAGRPLLPFFESRKKCPGFGKKGRNFTHLLITFSIENVVLRVSRRKTSKFLPCGAFGIVFLFFTFDQTYSGSHCRCKIDYIWIKLFSCFASYITLNKCIFVDLDFWLRTWITSTGDFWSDLQWVTL